MNQPGIYQGNGIGIAVLDTGIIQHVDFDERIRVFYDFIANKKTPYDDNGHGTHVSGIIAGKTYGVAPGAHLISLKVLDGMGNGFQKHTMQALQWILKNHNAYQIKIVNISVGSVLHHKSSYEKLLKIVEDVWNEGLIVVAAAGNDGPGAGSITVPGISRKIITVGTSDMLKEHLKYSGRGPTQECVCKPDIVCKGCEIISCEASKDKKSYIKKSGTSMSTAYISGSIALALEKDPYLTNQEIKMLLRNCAKDLGLPHNQQGWGEFDLKRFLAI